MSFVALTPALSQRERVPFGAILQSPLPLGEGQGEGIRATIRDVPQILRHSPCYARSGLPTNS
jgi:hypothetical protein